MTMSRTGKQGPWQAVVRCWKAHPRIAQFITYFLVGNLATLVQVVLIPVLQPVFGATGLVDEDLHLFGPIGDPAAVTTVTVAGETVTGINMLNGSLEQDKLFAPGDKAMVVVSYQGDEILSVTMTDHYRLSKEVLLAAIFAVFLILFAGRTGVRAIVSFVMTVLMLWKVLVPLYLKGYNPIFMGLAVTLVLTLFIIALVYGFDRRCAAAVSGAFLGVLVTCVLGVIFTDLFQIHGAVMSYSESLLYAGFQDLSLTQIFMASIFIGSSGAVMDLAVDITSAVHEVVEKRPDLSRWEAVRSGMNVGRAAMGTMTTTLLLAYSGGYVALLMVFMAQGTPLYNILNYKYVASEIIHTVVGSFGLVTVAPLTALTSGFLLAGRKGTAEAGLTPPPRPDGAALRSESGQ